MDKYLLIFKALSHRTRLQIILILRKKSLCVHQITDLIGCSMATISTHLKILKEADLLISNKVDQHVYYKTNCLSCDDKCSVCQILDGLDLDVQTEELLDKAVKKFPGEIHKCVNN